MSVNISILTKISGTEILGSWDFFLSAQTRCKPFQTEQKLLALTGHEPLLLFPIAV
jgi:hypothetical protein